MLIGCLLYTSYLLGIGNFHGALQANNQKTQHASTKIIKIGFPIQEGLSMKDEKGNYTGYMYDYLKELSQYTLSLIHI